MKMKNLKKSIILVILFCQILITNPVNAEMDNLNHFEMKYTSQFFWITLNGQYFDSPDYEFRLNFIITFRNDPENATFQLQIIEIETQKINISIIKKYSYKIRERTLYKNNNLIGRIHLLLDGGYEIGEPIVLQEFNGEKIFGEKNESGRIYLYEGQEIQCYSMNVKEEKYNYTGYHYIQDKNLLFTWIIDPGWSYDIQYEDLFLKNIFGVTGFFGKIMLKKTNVKIVEERSPSIFETLFPIILIGTISIAFLLTFYFIRGQLKKLDQNNRKSKHKYH